MHVRVVIADLVWHDEDGSAAGAALRLPALERLAARGRRQREVGCALEAWLCAEFGLDSGPRLPVAPYAFAAEGGEPGHRTWFRSDPVHVHVAREALLLADATTFALSKGEADELVGALNRHFEPDGLAFFAPTPSRWYLALADAPDIVTIPLPAARGQPVDGLLPEGRDAMRWHALLNEAQMLLHQHPVNAAREQAGAPPVNSIWLWGAGQFRALRDRAGLAVFADEPLARGLAVAAGASASPLPPSANALLTGATAQGNALVVLDALRAAADYRDPAAWRETVELLERDWLVPLLAALESKRIGMVTIHALGAKAALRIETARQDLRYVWRRIRPWQAYA